MISFPRGREVILGVSAGIAAYKSCELLRRLQDHGFLVTVVPTQASLNFVGRATWEALSGRPARSDVWEGSVGVDHVSLANEADLIVIAPTTADLLSRLATGRADDLLTTTVLASAAPLILVPAMHPGMWMNPATKANVATLRDRGAIVIEPDNGRLTGSESGVGRFPETARIISEVQKVSKNSGLLLGRRIVVTAGGTIEPIDSVRYIGNHSSGRQGLAIAYEALREGAEVTVIAGDTEEFELPGVNLVRVKTAIDMRDELERYVPSCDALVMAAAVADARPAAIKSEKIEKVAFDKIELIENPDLLAEVSTKRSKEQVLVGFAAETSSDLVERGRNKLHKKGVDLLFATNVSGGRVFGETLTTGALLTKRGEQFNFDKVDKHIVAKAILREMAKELDRIND